MSNGLDPEIALKNFIAALYKTLLLREPDPKGFESTLRHYGYDFSTENKFIELIRGFLLSEEFSSKVLDFLFQYVSAQYERFVYDQSQHSEVDLLTRLMINAAAAHRIVVDVGANGRARSNSYDLLKFCRWSGLLIEANPALIYGIEQEFTGLDVTVVKSAVSDYVGEANLYIGTNDDVSSLTEQNALSWGETKGKIEVGVRLLSEILSQHNIPKDFDLLSLDIEGEDIRVFNEILSNGNFRPKWVIIEASFGFSTKSLSDLPFCDLAKQLYYIAGQTTANLILKQDHSHGVTHTLATFQ